MWQFKCKLAAGLRYKIDRGLRRPISARWGHPVLDILTSSSSSSSSSASPSSPSSSSPSLSFGLYHERYSQSPLSDKSRQDRPQQWAALNQPSNTASARDLYVVGRIWVYLYLGVFPLQCGVDGVNLIGIPGSLAVRTSVSPLSSKAPTPRNTKFKRNTTTQEGGIHKYQNTGRWKRETHNVSNCTIVGFWI